MTFSYDLPIYSSCSKCKALRPPSSLQLYTLSLTIDGQEPISQQYTACVDSVWCATQAHANDRTGEEGSALTVAFASAVEAKQ